MTEDGGDDLIARVAAETDVPEMMLQALVGLERDFPDLNVWGAKPQLARRVSTILESAAAGRSAT